MNTLLLDAGNTVVYLDHSAVADLTGLDATRLRESEGAAKRQYESFLETSRDHGPGWDVFMRALIETAGAEGDLDALVAHIRAAHDVRNLWRRVPDGLLDGLRRIRAAGWKTGVVSNSEGRVIDILREVGAAPLLDVVVDSGVVGISKPDPRIFDIALEQLGVKPSDAIYAGDVPAVDVEGARAAGLRGVLVDTLGHYADYTDAPRYRHTVDLIDELLETAQPLRG